MVSVPSLPQTPVISYASITNAMGAANAQTCFTGGANGSKVIAVLATSTDTASQNVQLNWVRTSNNILLSTTIIPNNSGNTAGTTSVNLLSLVVGLPQDSDGNSFLFLANTGDTLTVQVATAVTAAKVINVTVLGANF